MECAELHVVRGMHALLSVAERPLLMVEVCASNLRAAGVRPGELFEAIVGYGYKGYVIRKGRLVPVESVVEPRRRWLGGEALDNYIFRPTPPQ